MKATGIAAPLNQLASLYNVQTAYYGAHHRRQQVSAESVLGILKVLGAPVASEKDIPSAIRERTLELRRRLMEPVTVAWNGERPKVKICCPAEPRRYPGDLPSGNGKRRANDLAR